MPFVIFNFQICYVFQAMGMGKEALIISACRQGIIYIPMILLMNAVLKCMVLFGHRLLQICLPFLFL